MTRVAFLICGTQALVSPVLTRSIALGKAAENAAFPHSHRACYFCWGITVFHRFEVSPIILNENRRSSSQPKIGTIRPRCFAPVQFRGMKKLARVAAIHCILLGWIVLGAAVFVAAEPIASLRPSNYVNDFAGVLDAATEARLNDLCRQVEEKAQAQIAVVTVKSVDGQDVVSYAVALYQKWGIGAKGKDRGVLILLATQDRKYWTTVGYGLEAILPDGKVGGFGREMVPLLRSGDYAGADRKSGVE